MSSRWIAVLGTSVLLVGCGTPGSADGWDPQAETEAGAGTGEHGGSSAMGSVTSSDSSTSDTDPTAPTEPTDDGSTTVPPDDDDTETTGEPTQPDEPVRYAAGRVHSPITAYVADQLRTYAESSAELREDVFLKAGASSTVSNNTLFCFDGEDSVDLGEHGDLEDALAYFRGGDAAGTTPFARVTLAAESGRSAQWVQAGSPSPLQQEVDAIDPRLALVHYGTNDMNLGATHGSAMVPFHEAMVTLIDDLLDDGTIPILYGITRRADSATAQLWVASYNAVIRGLAQSRQIPFIDLYEAVEPLPDHGLSSDGIHLLAFGQGACRLHDEGLQWGYNMRNLVSLQSLDRAMAVLVDDAELLDEEAPVFTGDGSPADPIMVDAFPFAHSADTADVGVSEIDAYPPCDDADESGPEVRYRLQLDEPTPLRIIVLDGLGVDVDVHIVEADGDGDSCLARANRRIEGTLPAGTWDIVVDTFSSGGESFTGEYLMVALPCDAGDEACAGGL